MLQFRNILFEIYHYVTSNGFFKCELNLKRDKKLSLFFSEYAIELNENVSKPFAQKEIPGIESVMMHLWYFPMKMSDYENRSQASFLSMKCRIEKIFLQISFTTNEHFKTVCDHNT
jgi:hypothetical protein